MLKHICKHQPGKPYWRRRLSTIDVLELTSSAFYIESIISPRYKTSFLNEEVNCTEPFPSFSVPRAYQHWTLVDSTRCSHFKLSLLITSNRTVTTTYTMRGGGNQIHQADPTASRGSIFSCVRPFYEWAVSGLDRSMHRSLYVYVAHSSLIEGSHTTKKWT
jgi:hypothetical protein